MTSLRALLVEDSPDDALLLVAALRRSGYDPEWTRVETAGQLRRALADGPGSPAPDVVVADYSLPAMTALDVLDIVAEGSHPAPVVVVSGAMDDEVCVATMHRGAADYLLKDRLARLGPSIRSAMERHRLTREADAAREQERVALQDRNEALQDRNESLRRLEVARDRFVATVSHELRTPLTSICGYTELLQEGAMGTLPADAAQAVDVVARNSRRLLRLVDQLLTLSALDSEAVVLRRTPVAVPELVRGVVDALRPAAADAEVDLHVDLAVAPESFRCDRALVERVLLDLVSNAVTFSRPGGRVRVEVGLDAGGTAPALRCQVRDDGVGIPADELPRVFERFFRGEAAHRDQVPGSGLGLALVREIALEHGGDVDVESVPGRGTTFTVRLPAGAGEDERPRPAPTVSAPVPRSHD